MLVHLNVVVGSSGQHVGLKMQNPPAPARESWLGTIVTLSLPCRPPCCPRNQFCLQREHAAMGKNKQKRQQEEKERSGPSLRLQVTDLKALRAQNEAEDAAEALAA